MYLYTFEKMYMEPNRKGHLSSANVAELSNFGYVILDLCHRSIYLSVLHRCSRFIHFVFHLHVK